MGLELLKLYLMVQLYSKRSQSPSLDNELHDSSLINVEIIYVRKKF